MENKKKFVRDFCSEKENSLRYQGLRVTWDFYLQLGTSDLRQYTYPFFLAYFVADSFFGKTIQKHLDFKS